MLRQAVAAIARLGQRVGRKRGAGVGGDQVVDRTAVLPLVEVVNELRALVADEPGVLEARRSLHRRAP